MKKLIIFITGGPGTGKSYTADRIIEKFNNLELVSYDAIKEVYWDKYGFKNKEEKEEINKLSLEGFYQTLDQKMKEGRTLISEYPFYQRHKPHLEKLVKDNEYQAITLLLYGDRHIIYEREKKRNQQFDRHPGHVLNCYDPKSFDHSQKVEPIVYPEDVFWQMIENKDYDINLGDVYKIDVSDYSKIDLNPVLNKIKEYIGED